MKIGKMKFSMVRRKETDEEFRRNDFAAFLLSSSRRLRRFENLEAPLFPGKRGKIRLEPEIFVDEYNSSSSKKSHRTYGKSL